MSLRQGRGSRSGGGERSGEGGADDCFAKAVELLGRRPHFRAELEKKLLARGFEAGDVAAALGRVAELGYLDDPGLARGYAAELGERKGLGRARIGRELARRGAGGEAVDGALDAISAEDDLQRAREAAARWARRGGEPEALARHLDRKGFARHVIFRVLREFAPDAEPPGEPD